MSDPSYIHNYNDKKVGFKSRIFAKMAQYPNVLIMYKAVAMIMVWSGIWGLFDEFLFPDNPALRYAILLCSGLFFLYIDDGSIDELADLNPAQSKHAQEIMEQKAKHKGR